MTLMIASYVFFPSFILFGLGMLRILIDMNLPNEQIHEPYTLTREQRQLKTLQSQMRLWATFWSPKNKVNRWMMGTGVAGCVFVILAANLAMGGVNLP